MSLLAASERREQCARILADLRSSREQDNESAYGAFSAVVNPFLIEAKARYDEEEMPDVPGILPAETTLFLVEEYRRTRQMLRAVVQMTHAGVRRVIDAGTGATAILALQAAFARNVETVLALELNPPNAFIAKKVVRAFGLAETIRVVHADATTYRPQLPVDLVVSETMSHGLLAEPLVPIMKHLRYFLRPGGMLVPDKARFFLEYVHDRRIFPTAPMIPIDFQTHAGDAVEWSVRLTPRERRRLHPRWDRVGIGVDIHLTPSMGWLNEQRLGIPLSTHDQSSVAIEWLREGTVKVQVYPGKNLVLVSSAQEPRKQTHLLL